MKEMFGFAGWNFFGTGSALLRDQGGSVLINIFYGPSVNAARGVAMQVNSAISNFVASFTTAVNPQITKSYAAGERDYMMKLVFRSTKFSFFIILLIGLPILVSTPYILELWLKQVPEYAVSFVRLVVIFAMSDTLAKPLVTLMLATGDIKKYQIIVGGSRMIVDFPVSLLCLYLGAPPECVFIVAIATSFMCEMLRLGMLKKMVDLPVKSFMLNVYLKSIFVAVIAAVIPWIIKTRFGNDFSSFVILSVVSVACAIATIYIIGCNRN